jgi:signal transduction histidine kinase
MAETEANILVIDDEVGMREGCRRALTPHGFHVSVAEHGVEGLRKLREGHFDLILVDAMMPGLSGLELLDRVYEYDPDIVCIMITGYATVDLAAQAMKKGARDFLPKPFTSDELLAVVRKSLDERKRRLALEREKELAEEQLQLERISQERAKLDAIESRFMLVIAHKLRDPAGVIKSYLQLMRCGFVDEDEWDEYLEKLDLRAGQLLAMLDELLELAHLKSGIEPSKLKPVALADSLEEAVGHFRPAAEAKGLHLDLHIEGRPVVLANPNHLRTLWTHLVENAVHYTPQGEIEIRLTEERGWAVGTIADSGIGISTEEMGSIFQEFYRTEAARDEVVLGTGLGLPIVNQILAIYGGTVQVDSVPGKGSTFTIRLPLAPPGG